MSTNKFITIVSGLRTLVTAISSSAGVSDANKIIATDSSGRIDSTLMPTGIGPSTLSVVASEALVAGDFVNFHNNAGTLNMRKADSSNGREAHGFVLASVSSSATGTAYRTGVNTGRTSLTPGTIYYLSTAGGVTTTAPTASGSIVQPLGVAESATAINFEYDQATSIA